MHFVKDTDCTAGEDVVQYSVGSELVTVALMTFPIKSNELCLTLIKLLMVPFLKSNTSMSLVYLNYKLVSYILNLKTKQELYKFMVSNMAKLCFIKLKCYLQ